MAANNGKAVSNGGTNAGATVHFSLQGKGGVGKSVVASWLAQYLRSKDLSVTCIDTDPVNATMTQFKDLNAEHLNVLKSGGINEKQFDVLVERVCSRDGIYVVDTGATTFVPLWHYMLEHQLFHFLVEHRAVAYLYIWLSPAARACRTRSPDSSAWLKQHQIRASSCGSTNTSGRWNVTAKDSRISNSPSSSPPRSPAPFWSGNEIATPSATTSS